jgi:hypothetical protein
MAQQDGFTVYLRRPNIGPPEEMETALAWFADRAEALRLQQECQKLANDCIIRYEGETGGSD